MSKSVPMSLAKASLAELASRASAGERFTLVRRGKPVAALVGSRDLARLESSAGDSTLVRALRAFRRRHARSLPREPLRVRRSPGRLVP